MSTALKNRIANLLDLKVKQGYDAAATSIVVEVPAAGPALPAVPFPLVWYKSNFWLDVTADPNAEIIWVDAKTFVSGIDWQLTVRRGQDGTTAKTHNEGGATYRTRCALTRDLFSNQVPWVSVLDYGADPTGTNDSSGAFQKAVDASKVVLVPDGTYLISATVNVPTGTMVLGASRESTLIKSGASLAGGLFSCTGGGIHIEDLRFDSASGHGSTPSITHQSSGSGEDTDLVFRRLRCVQQNVASHGITFVNNGADLRRVLFEDVTILNTGTGDPGTSMGLNCSVGAKIGRELRLINVTIDGFHDGFNSNSSTGQWEHTQAVNLTCKNAKRFGARFYHFGELELTNGWFDDCGCGAWFDQGGDNEEVILTGCWFTRNYLAFFVEEWSRSVISDCVVFDNTYGAWISSGRETVVEGCVVAKNDEWGISTDRTGTLTDPATSIAYTVTNENQLTDLRIEACVVSLNGKNGIELRGLRRSVSVSGCTVTRNGVSHSGSAATSGFASILIDTEAVGGGASYDVVITGCTLGNPGNGGGVGDEGKEQYGIRATSSSYTHLAIKANHFAELETPISTTTGDKEAIANDFYLCNSITWSGGVRHWDSSNVIRGGNLEATVFYGTGYTETVDLWFRDDVANGLTNSELVRQPQGAGAGGWIPLRDGWVTAIFVHSNAAVTAGTITAEVFVNGTGTGLTAVLDTTNTTFKVTRQRLGLDAFVAGQKVDIRITTSSLTPAGSLDIRAGLEVRYGQ